MAMMVDSSLKKQPNKNNLWFIFENVAHKNKILILLEKKEYLLNSD
jgi:hypothetical protein